MNAFRDFSFDDIIRIAIAAVVIFASLLSILYVIWGGFLMIISGGNEEKIKPAVNHIRHAAIGLLFLFGVLYIAPVLMSLIGVPYGEYAKPAAVLETIGQIFGTIFDSEITPPTMTTGDTPLPADFSNDF